MSQDILQEFKLSISTGLSVMIMSVLLLFLLPAIVIAISSVMGVWVDVLTLILAAIVVFNDFPKRVAQNNISIMKFLENPLGVECERTREYGYAFGNISTLCAVMLVAISAAMLFMKLGV